MPDIAKEIKLCNSFATLSHAYKPVASNRANQQLRGLSSLQQLAKGVREYVEEKISLCQPDDVHVCTGSKSENETLLNLMQNQGTIESLPKYKNCWLARTNPKDVARVESRTFICTKDKHETVPRTKDGVKCALGNWISYHDYNRAVQERFPQCMKGGEVGFLMNVANPLTCIIGLAISETEM